LESNFQFEFVLVKDKFCEDAEKDVKEKNWQ
jgi:hypothetical protein